MTILVGLHHFVYDGALPGMASSASGIGDAMCAIEDRIENLERSLACLVQNRYLIGQLHYALAFGRRISGPLVAERTKDLVVQLSRADFEIRKVECTIETERAEYRRLVALVFRPSATSNLRHG